MQSFSFWKIWTEWVRTSSYQKTLKLLLDDCVKSITLMTWKREVGMHYYCYYFVSIVSLQGRECQENVPVRITGGSTYLKTTLLWTMASVEYYKMEIIVKHFGLNAWISNIVGSQNWQSSCQSCWSFSNSRGGRTAHEFLRMGTTSSIAGNVFDKYYKFIVYKSTLLIRFHTDKWAVLMD